MKGDEVVWEVTFFRITITNFPILHYILRYFFLYCILLFVISLTLIVFFCLISYINLFSFSFVPTTLLKPIILFSLYTDCFYFFLRITLFFRVKLNFILFLCIIFSLALFLAFSMSLSEARFSFSSNKIILCW